MMCHARYSALNLVALLGSGLLALSATGCDLSANTPSPTTYKVGDTGPAGGIIFYDSGNTGSGWRYLEAAPANQASSGTTTWGGSGVLVGATSTVIGTGAANTAAIISALGSGTYAAMICHSYSLGGYSDWFLPSQQELHLMYQNLKANNLGNFTGTWYFSSSEVDANNAYEWVFTTDTGGTGDFGDSGPKTASMGSVRAIRAF